MSQPQLADLALAGALVRLRPVELGDVDEAFELTHQRRAVTDWLVWDGPETREELVPWYGAWASRGRRGDDYQLAVVDRATERFCGSVGLRFAESPGDGELGYWLGEAHWRRGKGAEAVGLAVHTAFAWLEARRVHAHVFEGNRASEALLGKLGFEERPEGLDVVEKSGRFRPRRLFALTREAWRARRERIRPREERVDLLA